MDYKEQLKKVLADIRAVIDTAKAENRGLKSEEREKLDTMHDEVVELRAMIDAEARQTRLEAELNSSGGMRIEKPEGEHRDNTPKPFASFGEQMMAVAMETITHRADPRLEELRAASGMNEKTPSEGGIFVQKDFTAELLQHVHDTAALVPRARTIGISATSNGLKINGVDETSRANGSRWGGIRVYWETEGPGSTHTASKPKFRQIELNLHKVIGAAYATDELLADTNALGAILEQAFTEEFAFVLDDAIMRGTGQGQPLGFLNSPALVSVAAETGQDASTILYENIIKMWSRMPARNRANAAWLINQDCEPQLYTMSLPIGTGGVPVYLPPTGAAGAPFGTLMGRPLLPIEQAESVGTVGDISLVDLGQYLMIDKGGMQQASSMHVRFLYDEMCFKFTYRVDGQPIWHKPLTPYKGTSNTQSPFVVLATR